MRLKHPLAGRDAGFSLIEVLIALVILSVGLLGIAAMVSVAMKSKGSSYLRTQALAQAQAIIDRMRANRATALQGYYDFTDARGTVSVTSGSGNPATGISQQSCVSSSSTCTPTQIAAMDMYQWKHDLEALLGNGQSSNVSFYINTTVVAQFTQVQVALSWDDTIGNAAANGTTSTSAASAACSAATSAPASIATATGYSNCYNSIIITSGL